ncbi:MAG: hypothetical protein HY327_10460 [Chloroflexi bacterium]|nr:hypothetical protein [Chloroflexota bacterium]
MLIEVARRVQSIITARNRAQAKASDALLSARMIPAVLLFVTLTLSRDPNVALTLQAGPVQLVLAGVAGLMMLGYFVMRSMVLEAA